MIQHGSKVRCASNSIDKQMGEGLVGTVTGFAQFSSYHPREAFVSFEDNPPNTPNGNWFWLSDLSPL